MLLAPCMNFARVPEGGRNFESSGVLWFVKVLLTPCSPPFHTGADPYLQGEVAYHTVKGIQSKGVQACAKHYICNEQEHFRQSSSSNVDDATLHSIYLHPFLRSIQADVAVRFSSPPMSFINQYVAERYDVGLDRLLT